MGSSVNRSLQAKFHKSRRAASAFSFDRAMEHSIGKRNVEAAKVEREVIASHWSQHFGFDAIVTDKPVTISFGKWR